MTPAEDPATQTARRRGRRLGIAVFIALVGVITAVWSVQIILQVWNPPPSAAGDCREGVAGLIHALDRARGAASRIPSERERLLRFRAALQPEWSAEPALAERCAGDAELSHALDEIRSLRYEEEQAVRNPAAKLAAKRGRVEALAERVRGPKAPGAEASP
jgi:hypothetical protein